MSRRKFIQLTSICASNIILSSTLTGCNSVAKKLSSAADFSFNHGVASGDPVADGMILWTRVTPLITTKSLVVGWEVSKDAQFSELELRGSANVDETTDFTLKVDARGLMAGQLYYYRFVGNGIVSSAGKCKTLPTEDVEQINFIVCSCANYPAGYFHAYADAAKQTDIDAVLHLGDYLYEYGMGQYATEHAVEIGRELPQGNDQELLTLNDYRQRYNLYHTDPSLQKLHAAAAFILVWDDHEIANDTWRNGAENHSPNEGDFGTRKYNAIKAWYEWLPVRVSDQSNKEKIYRRFDFGQLLTLHMLDTRVIARDKQLNVADYKHKSTGKFNSKKFKRDLNDKNRALIGTSQFSWLHDSISKSNAKWQLLGQQILIGKMFFPAELSKYRKQLNKIPAILNTLSSLKNSMDSNQPISDQDKKRLQRKFPYNLDAWDGYPAEREKLYKLIKQTNTNVLVISGDTHNAWANTLTDNDGEVMGAEFAVQSISSPGMEKYLEMDAESANQTATSLTNLVDGLSFCNLYQRGYLKLQIRLVEVKADWFFVDNILTDEYQVTQGHSLRYPNQ